MLRLIVIWIFGFTIALISGLTAIGAITKDKAAELAVTISPTNGFSLENLATASIKAAVAENQGKFPDHVAPPTVVLARKAFIAEPLTPEAVAVLALAGPKDVRQKLMGAALILSRRQRLVNGWMIADSGAREETQALLNHYDTIMRTSTSVASAAIPVLTEALANDNSVAPFAKLLEKQPPWANQFWRTVVGRPNSLGNAAQLRKMLYKPDESDEVYRDIDLIRGLIRNQQFEQAWSLYQLFAGQNKTISLIKNGSFETKTIYPPIDWQLFSTGEYGAAIVDGNLQLSAIRNSGGTFARSLVRLPAKILTMKVNPVGPIPDNARMFARLRCAQALESAPKPIRIPLKNEIDNLQIDNSQSGCSFYWLDINGRASDSGEGFDIAIESISLNVR